MRILMQDYLLHLYYEVNALKAGLKKRSLPLNVEKSARFSYYEKGTKVPGQSSMVFIHGFSSNKEAWVSLVDNISDGYHCILIDLPGHGETIGLKEDEHIIDEVIEELKLFLDKMKLIEPIYMIGASMGGTIVAMFTIKYPEYVSMICLLAPPPTKEYESGLIKKVQSGMYYVLLPETPEQFNEMTDLLTTKKVSVPKSFVHRYFKSRLRVLDDQRKILRSFLEKEYDNLEQHYEGLKDVKCPALIIWGRTDKLCKVDGAEYFSKLIPDSEVIIFDDCGHFISYDLPKETAKTIINFLDLHSYCIIEDIDETIILSN